MASVPTPRRPRRRLTDTERRAAWLTRVQAPLDEARPEVGIPEFVQALQERVPNLTQQLVHTLQREVTAFAGGKTRRAIIRRAARSATGEFFALLEGTVPNDPAVSQSFQQVGFGIASEGNTLEPMHIALRIAHLEAWRVLSETATTHQVSTHFLGSLGEALDLYFAHLEEEAAHGHTHGVQMRDADRGVIRERLLAEICVDDHFGSAEDRADRITVLAAGADWPLASEVVAMRVAFEGEFPTLAEPHHDILMDARRAPALLVCSPQRAEEASAELLLHDSVLRISISWPVSPTELPAADRIARRTLDLVRLRETSSHRVLRTTEHMYQLWIHSEPELRRRLVNEMLQPLLTEKPRSRRLLAETLLAWIATRDSAPIVAERMGVHPQTVRYRQRRMREVFGDLLEDPEFIAVASLTLRASLPFWRIGDDADLMGPAPQRRPAKGTPVTGQRRSQDE
ncbi:helix-turn-helix domain-containing protein [Nocardioides sp. Bht2]|uniref:PucR family transcriptional regulator n=1 Tax=Nocardioides sp. Bht2 TaxID=3392297 RepID=UPI0039B67789